VNQAKPYTHLEPGVLHITAHRVSTNLEPVWEGSGQPADGGITATKGLPQSQI